MSPFSRTQHASHFAMTSVHRRLSTGISRVNIHRSHYEASISIRQFVYKVEIDNAYHRGLG